GWVAEAMRPLQVLNLSKEYRRLRHQRPTALFQLRSASDSSQGTSRSRYFTLPAEESYLNTLLSGKASYRERRSSSQV
ncbi:MAG: hypothetical protein ACREIH_05815, partial [Nitrospiraceae bacterium]